MRAVPTVPLLDRLGRAPQGYRLTRRFTVTGRTPLAGVVEIW
jgi:hypothetical protein